MSFNVIYMIDSKIIVGVGSFGPGCGTEERVSPMMEGVPPECIKIENKEVLYIKKYNEKLNKVEDLNPEQVVVIVSSED